MRVAASYRWPILFHVKQVRPVDHCGRGVVATMRSNARPEWGGTPAARREAGYGRVLPGPRDKQAVLAQVPGRERRAEVSSVVGGLRIVTGASAAQWTERAHLRSVWLL